MKFGHPRQTSPRNDARFQGLDASGSTDPSVATGTMTNLAAWTAMHRS